jgi:hypothetical protein
MLNDDNNLLILLQLANVPDSLIEKIMAKPMEYRETFWKTIQAILKNEVMQLLEMVDTREEASNEVKRIYN